jgi:hypothetical protein
MSDKPGRLTLHATDGMDVASLRLAMEHIPDDAIDPRAYFHEDEVTFRWDHA